MSRSRDSAPVNVGSELQARFGKHLARDKRVEPGDRVVVAFSGGVDSLVLLHLLRFKVGRLRLEVRAAHFDHRMRPGSEADAQWAQGVCRAWRVPLRTGRANALPRSEEGAREARYAFFQAVRQEEKARWVMTAHQADDQAETVLFRALRGTGLKGLGGIPAVRHPGIYRPLLPFRRREIEEYATSQGLRAREDPTNRQTAYARNFLRHRVLPDLEANVSPGATEALCRLGRLARENERAWRSLIPGLLEGVLEADAEGLVVVRSRLLSYDPGVQGRLLREVLRRSGVRLDEAGTRVALEFTRTGASGRSLDLPGGIV